MVKEPEKKFCYEYPRPAVTVDAVLFHDRPEGRHVLLIKRKNYPFEGQWALPGGFVDMDEDLPDAAKRELFEETGVTGVELVQVGAFGKPDRDPRGRTVGIAFAALLDEKTFAKLTVRAGDDAADAQWFPVANLPQLAFDHDEIIATALADKRL